MPNAPQRLFYRSPWLAHMLADRDARIAMILGLESGQHGGFLSHFGTLLAVSDERNTGRLLRAFEEDLSERFPIAEIERQTFKVGDRVRVERRVKAERGWDNAWVVRMDEAIGEELKVQRVDHTGVYLYMLDWGVRYGFPPSSLVHV